MYVYIRNSEGVITWRFHVNGVRQVKDVLEYIRLEIERALGSGNKLFLSINSFNKEEATFVVTENTFGKTFILETINNAMLNCLAVEKNKTRKYKNNLIDKILTV